MGGKGHHSAYSSPNRFIYQTLQPEALPPKLKSLTYSTKLQTHQNRTHCWGASL